MIPAMIMGRVRLLDTDMDNRANRKYVFNAEEGWWSHGLKHFSPISLTNFQIGIYIPVS